jgi:hypothetical protein
MPQLISSADLSSSKRPLVLSMISLKPADLAFLIMAVASDLKRASPPLIVTFDAPIHLSWSKTLPNSASVNSSVDLCFQALQVIHLLLQFSVSRISAQDPQDPG